MILILYTNLELYSKAPFINKYIHTVTPFIKNKILEKRNEADRAASLAGIILLQRGLMQLQPDNPPSLYDMQYTRYKKPYFPFSKIDFNISHAGSYVVSALSYNCKLGVDIEHIKPVNIDDFTQFMHVDEITSITTSADPDTSFYRFWTQKECVLKANGKGLNIPLTDVSISNHQTVLENEKWNIREIAIDKQYLCNIAYSSIITDWRVHLEYL